MSINVEPEKISPSLNIPIAIPEGRPVPNRAMPSSLPPYMSINRPSYFDKSRTPSGGSEDSEVDSGSSVSSEEKMTEEFPFGPAFKAAMGRLTTFPDGTGAVMIDSAVALEAFQEDQMVKK